MLDTLASHRCLRSRAALLAALFLCLPNSAEAAEDFAQRKFKANLFLNQGKQLLEEKKYERALTHFERTIEAVKDIKDERDSTRGVPYTLKAAALIQLERFSEAESAARTALKLGDTNAFEKLAYAQLQQGSYMRAARNATQAIKLRRERAQRFEILSATEAIKLRLKRAQGYAILAFASESLGHDVAMKENIRLAAKYDSTFQPKLDLALSGGKIFQRRGAARALQKKAKAKSAERKSMVGIAAGMFLALCVGVIGALQLTKRTQVEEVPRSKSPAALPQEEERLLSGKYELIQVIGKGGMGHVWEAMDHSLKRKVAVKKMTEELGRLGSTAREYYLKEARTVASLEHPHIIGIYEILDLPSGVYLVFELAVGKTIQQILAEEKRMDLEQVRKTLEPVCDALEFAHSRGFVHRDLKPANIMILSQGFVKVMDFGIARRVEERVESSQNAEMSEGPAGLMMARTRTIVGTPPYMPPEAAQGVVSPLTDIYTLGVCYYEMLTGELPFSGGKMTELKARRQYQKPSQRVQGLSAEVDKFFHDAVDPNPKTRIQTPREFAARMVRAQSA